MSRPEDHLLRAEAIDAPGLRTLSRLAGISRLTIEQHRLATDGEVALAPGREQFLYVLAGAGSISAVLEPGMHSPAGQPARESITLGAGDFVGLSADEGAVLNASGSGMAVLIGKAPRQVHDDPAAAD